MQTDDGAVAAGSTEITAETIAEELSEEESFRDFITQTHAEDYEAQEGWYRWTYTVKEIDVDRILETLKNRDYSSQSIKNFSKITDITIVKRGPGGVADELVIATDKGTYKIISEYNIRAVLCDGVTRVVRQDGSEVSMPSLLPSAFFVIEPSHDNNQHLAGFFQPDEKTEYQRLCIEYSIFPVFVGDSDADGSLRGDSLYPGDGAESDHCTDRCDTGYCGCHGGESGRGCV